MLPIEQGVNTPDHVASRESGITLEPEFKFCKILLFEPKTVVKNDRHVWKEETVSATFEELLGTSIANMGRVTLGKVVIKTTTTDSGQFYRAVITNATANVGASAIAGRKGGYGYKTTAYNFGDTKETEVKVPDLYTRQIKPVSSSAPMPKMVMSYGGGMEVIVEIYYDCDGPVYEYSTYVG